jgi:hypothetical protein
MRDEPGLGGAPAAAFQKSRDDHGKAEFGLAELLEEGEERPFRVEHHVEQGVVPDLR